MSQQWTPEEQQKIAKIQAREQRLKEETRERESRTCEKCGRGFRVPPGSIRRGCSLPGHDDITRADLYR